MTYKTSNGYYYIFLIICHQCLNCESNPLVGSNVRQAEENEFPFVVSISRVNFDEVVNNEQFHICGGSLITRRHVLTSAHCVYSIDHRRNFVVEVGSSDLRKVKHHRIRSWITYDNWVKKNNVHANYTINDIAIIELSKRVSSDIQLGVITNYKNVDLFGKSARTAGWGNTNNDTVTRYLIIANLNILSRDKCMRSMRKPAKYGVAELTRARFLCTISEPHAVLGCGDSGGPLLLDGNEIIGINDSVCPTDNDNNNPQRVNLMDINIHVGVDFYRDFITDVIKEKHPCGLPAYRYWYPVE